MAPAALTGRELRSPGARGAIPKSAKSLGSTAAAGVGEDGWLGTSAIGDVAGLIMDDRLELNLSFPKRLEAPDFLVGGDVSSGDVAWGDVASVLGSCEEGNVPEMGGADAGGSRGGEMSR